MGSSGDIIKNGSPDFLFEAGLPSLQGLKIQQRSFLSLLKSYILSLKLFIIFGRVAAFLIFKAFKTGIQAFTQC